MDKPAQYWWVYIVKTKSGKLYTGITTDLERRFKQHKGELKGGARFFHTDPAEVVVYREQSEGRSHASRREAAIKKMTRQKKIALIESSGDMKLAT